MSSVTSRILLALALLVTLAAAPSRIFAQPVKTEHVLAELIAEQTSVQPGKPFTVALRIQHAPHWHTYWRNPGDSGLPTKIQWELPAGYTAGPIQWPYPHRLPLGPLTNFGYENELLLLTDITAPANASGNVTLKAKGDWLVCKDICIPEGGSFSLTLPVSADPGPKSTWASVFKRTRDALPVAPKGWETASTIEGGVAKVTVKPLAGTTHQPKGLFFYPYQEGSIENAKPQPVAAKGNGYELSVTLMPPVPPGMKTLPGILVSDNGWGLGPAKAITVGDDPGQSTAIPTAFGGSATTGGGAGTVAATTAAAPAASVPTSTLTFWAALAFAFIGGLILNLMPCVFPVLGIKVMGFVQNAHEDNAILRKQGLTFLAGVVVSFWVLAGILLALKAGGQALGWGFQLQSPLFVTALAILFTLMALNLFGVFEIGLGLQTAAGNVTGKGIFGEAFLSGVLATVVATPCTAPFMGAALGFTLSQPAHVAILVFTALALGMAAPVTLLSLFPAGLKWLPKPGAWMATFKQFMAFPLLATVVWLVWVLGSQQGNTGVMQLLCGLVLIGMAAWAYGRWGMQGSKLATAASVALLAGGIAFAWPGAPDTTANIRADGTAKPGQLPWQPWSQDKVAQLRGEGKAVFVDFTATWCITCQVNKRVALHDAAVIKRFADTGVVPLMADWTRQDPAITAALASFGRNAVPLYVMYPPSGDPVVLPEVLTPSLVLAELGKVAAASGGSKQAAR
ncbi:MAG: protein-disulfide reductase DsbD family protein [Burkholderiales bacterium]|nr:protein-disulfide reductase DsbD family protein [Burkholderiales bacterium]